MKHNFPGWYSETLPSGSVRHVVRQEGNPRKKTTVPVGPDDPAFLEHYWAARAGKKYEPEAKPKAPAKSFGALVESYLEQLEAEVRADLKSPLTLKQRRTQLRRASAFQDVEGTAYEELHVEMPQAAFVKLRNAMVGTPAEADNVIKAIRAAYRHGIEVGMVSTNPAEGVGKIHKSLGGAKPWTTTDLKAYRERHEPGTMAHLYLTLLMFTGARISDAIKLGRKNEVRHGGQLWLEWQPGKKGSRPVAIPVLPPLERTLRAMKVEGETYVLNERGQPFKNAETLRVRMRRWCDQAELSERSSHGVRKALGGLLGEAGCSTRQIGAILSHVKPDTTAIYTESAERRLMSADAMAALHELDW